MRRLGAVAAALLLALLLQTAASFAETLQIVNTHPEDGKTNVYPLNFAVKVYFNQDVSGARDIYANRDNFTLTDQENNRQPITVLYDSKTPEKIGRAHV